MSRGGRRPGAGRPKGSLGRRTIDAAERLAALRCDPLEGMARIAEDASCPLEIRARMYAELAGYVYAKRRAVEVAGTIEQVGVRLDDARAIAARLIQARQVVDASPLLTSHRVAELE